MSDRNGMSIKLTNSKWQTFSIISFLDSDVFLTKKNKNVFESTIKNKRTKKERNQKFCFQFVSEIECKKEITNLNANKPLVPSDLPVWALKDGCNENYSHLIFLINEFIKYN